MTSRDGDIPSVLVAHSYYLRYDEKQLRKMKPYPPLATLLAAAVLRERGYPVQVFDAMLAPGVDAFRERLGVTRPRVVAVIEDNFNFLTKMCTARMREAALDTIRAARAAGCRVIVNGADATDEPSVYLDAGAEAVIVGEPEDALCEVVDHWMRKADCGLDRVPGLALPAETDGTGVRFTASRPPRSDLDDLPFPAWDLISADPYREAWTAAHGRLSWNVVTSRGCPYRCNWCAKPLFGSQYRQRSPHDVALELKQLKRQVGPDHLWFADDIFGLTASWIVTFADAVRAHAARIPFMMQSRVNLMTANTVAALAEAGAEEVWLGVESGSQRILDAMEKGTKIEQIRAATRALKEAGIRSCWFIQLGYLGEGWAEIVMTRDLIREERPDDIGVSVSYPLPGTKFYETVKRQFGPKTHWDDSDDLAMMFAGTYTTPFYRQVRTLLHDEVDLPDGSDADARQALDRRWETLETREAEFRSPVMAAARE